MYRMDFEKGKLKKYIQKIQDRLNLSLEEIAEKLDISARTLRDWKREKFKPNSKIIQKINQISGISIPSHKILPSYWFTTKAANLGGIKRIKLYGNFGTQESRSKGGIMSALKRKTDPELWKKYTNSFNIPKKSEELAEFIGIMLGDGGLTYFQCTIYINSLTEQEYAKYIKNMIKRLFNYEININKKKKENVLILGISGVNIVKYLKGIGLSLGNKVKLQVGVPDWIWEKDVYIKACLRGLIDTDGCFFQHRYTINKKEYQYYKMCFSNKSEPLLDFVKKGLEKLGFHPKRTYISDVWLHNQNEVKKYLKEIKTHNIKPVIKKIIGGVR